MSSYIKVKKDSCRVYIPKSMQTEIIRRTHDPSHSGKAKVLEKISKNYCIDGLSAKIDNYIKN